MHLRTFLIVSALALLAAGCVVGPESDRKSRLNYLNGEHYRADVVLHGVPVLIERRTVNTRISGHAVVKGSRFHEPTLRFEELVLYSDAIEVSRTRTDEHGAFAFCEGLKTGTYRIAPADERYRGEVAVVVDSYIEENVVLRLEPRADGAPSHP